MAPELIAQGIGSAVGLVQTIINSGKEKRANREQERLFKQRKAFQTPSEVFDILNLTTSNAAQGYSDDTMQFLTGQAGSGLAGSLATAERLGADPNQLSGLLDSYYGDIFKIGAENDLLKMKKFDSLTNALQLVAANKEAEYQSKENLLKDRMQSVASRVQAANVGQQSGLNLLTSGLANLAAGFLYDNSTPNRPGITASNIPATVPERRKLDLSIGNQRGNYTI